MINTFDSFGEAQNYALYVSRSMTRTLYVQTRRSRHDACTVVTDRRPAREERYHTVTPDGMIRLHEPELSQQPQSQPQQSGLQEAR